MPHVNVWGNIAADAVRRPTLRRFNRPQQEAHSAFIPTFSLPLPSKQPASGVNLTCQSGDDDDQPDR